MFDDPNWLMSSTAQSAAAVVAIVAGFITTRILVVSSERRALHLTILQRKNRIAFLDDRRKELTDNRRYLLLRQAFESVRNRLKNDEDPSIEEVRADVGFGVPDDLLKSEFERLVSERNYVRSFVQENLGTIDSSDPDVERWVRRVALDPGKYEWDFIWHYFEAELERQREAERGPSSLYMSSLALPRTSGYALEPNPEREIELELREVSMERRGVIGEIEALDASLDAVTMPTTTWIAIVILVYLSLTSVLFPLYLLPSSTTEEWMTPVVVGLFALGLLSLMGYIGVELNAAKTTGGRSSKAIADLGSREESGTEDQ